VRGTYWYVAPFLNQAKKIVWQEPEMLAKYCPPEVWEKRNNSDLTLKFPNGSILYVLGADKPDSLRGPNPRGVVLDEYGDMRQELWSGIIQPIMTANPQGWTWFMGTPKGRNDFFNKYNYAVNYGDPNWFASSLKASQSGIIRADLLEDARKTTTQAFFSQEYECEFLESASSFFRRVRENVYSEQQAQFLVDNAKHLQFSMGIDLAKYNDWSVLTPFCLNNFYVLPQDRFNQVDWNVQKARIEASYYRYNKPRIQIDSTGLGDPIVDDLIARGIPIDTERGDNVKFTGGDTGTRRQILDHLAILLEQGIIKLPKDEGLFTELESFQYTLSDTGKVKVMVPEGIHDDRVMSLALAVRDCGEALGMPNLGSERMEDDQILDRLDRYSVI